MAERGGQKGNNNAGRNKPWQEALTRALIAEDGKKLRAIAEKLIERAADGDVTAIKEIGDRMDGKAAQQVILAGDEDHPLRIERIVREVVKA